MELKFKSKKPTPEAPAFNANYNNEFEKVMYDAYDSLTLNNPHFINYEQVYNQFLIALNKKELITNFLKYRDESYEALKKRQEVVFENFTIGWTRDNKYSFDKLIPTLKVQESRNSLAFLFKAHQNAPLSPIISKFNQYLTDLIVKNHVCEVYQGIIVFKDPNTQTLKLLFDFRKGWYEH